MSLSVAILNYNNAALTKDALDSVLAQRMQPDEIVVFDNGSETYQSLLLVDIVEERREGTATPIVMHRVDHNQGNIAGMNMAIEACSNEFVVFMANDVRLHSDCLDQLHMALLTNPDLGIVQPILYQPNGDIDNVGLSWRWPGYGLRIRQLLGRLGGIMGVDAVAATCFGVRKSFFQHLGGFDDRLGISHEDIDFGIRVRKAGAWCGAYLQPSATHLMGQTIPQTVSKLRPYYRDARQRVIRTHYQGWDQSARLAAVRLLDGVAARVRGG